MNSRVPEARAMLEQGLVQTYADYYLDALLVDLCGEIEALTESRRQLIVVGEALSAKLRELALGGIA